jgi:maleate isomerase
MADVIRIGVLTPHVAVGPEVEFAAMVPGSVTCVARISADPEAVPTGASTTSSQALRALTAPPFPDRAVELLRAEPIDVIGYASTTTAYAIGFAAETAMVSRLSALAGVSVLATCASAVLALRVLGVERVALIGAPWFEYEFNELGSTYFRSQGFDVVSSASADLPQDPSLIESTAIYEWTSRHVGVDAEAIFIGGNGFRAAGAIDRLEAALGRPVLTSNQVLLWSILNHAEVTFAVAGYGALFGHHERENAGTRRASA